MRRRIAQFMVACAIAVSAVCAAEISGIWTGTQQGRRGEPEDVAFRLKLEGTSLSGKLLGDEFDIPVEEGSVSGDEVRFAVTVTNYYSGTKTKFVYSGQLKGTELELTRERILTPEEKASPRPNVNTKQTLRLKRLT